MSRFPGWTAEAIEALQSDSPLVDMNCRSIVKVASITPAKVKANKPAIDYVGMISGALQLLGINHEREYKFLHDRRFRFDIAIPEHKLAIEFEGGIYSGGRHTRGKGYARDAKKYNLAVMHGWRLLRYTSEDAKEVNWEFKIAEEIKKIIGEK